jgi:hypothetical protein
MLTGTVLLVGIGIFLSTATLGILLKKFKVDEEISRKVGQVSDTVNQVLSRFHILAHHPDEVRAAANNTANHQQSTEPLLEKHGELPDPTTVTLPLLYRYAMPLPFIEKPLPIVFLSRETLSILLKAIGFGSIGFSLGRLIFNGLLVSLFHVALPTFVVVAAPIALGVCLMGLAAYFKYQKVIHQIAAKKLIELATAIETQQAVMDQAADKTDENDKEPVRYDTVNYDKTVEEFTRYSSSIASITGTTPVVVHSTYNDNRNKPNTTRILSSYKGQFHAKEISGTPPTSASEIDRIFPPEDGSSPKKTL